MMNPLKDGLDLQMTEEEMRSLAHLVTELVMERVGNLSREPAGPDWGRDLCPDASAPLRK